jgi:hypothetical protein
VRGFLGAAGAMLSPCRSVPQRMLSASCRMVSTMASYPLYIGWIGSSPHSGSHVASMVGTQRPGLTVLKPRKLLVKRKSLKWPLIASRPARVYWLLEEKGEEMGRRERKG